MEYIDNKTFWYYVINNDRVNAMKSYKAVTNCSLKEAKVVVDTLMPSGLTVFEGDWLYELSKHHRVYIAGGFLRDTLLGRPVKDIDVYVLISEGVEHIRFQLHSQTFKKITGEPYEGIPNNPIRNVYECKANGYTRLNIITMNPNVNFRSFIEDSFDIGLCKIYYEVQTGLLHTSPEFDKDVRNKTLTVSHYRPENDHLRRILAKYPKYTVVMKHEQQEEAPF